MRLIIYHFIIVARSILKMMMQSQALRTSTVHGQRVVTKSAQRSSAFVGRKATLQVECRSIEAGTIRMKKCSGNRCFLAGE